MERNARNVVISGMGAVTPYGADHRALIGALGRRDAFDSVAQPFPTISDIPIRPERVARVSLADGEPAQLRRPIPDRFTRLGIAAADNAIADAHLAPGSIDGRRLGIVITTTFGPRHTVEKYLRTLASSGPGAVSPIDFSRAVTNSILGEIARRHGIMGPGTVLVGSPAIPYCADIIKTGKADVVLCLGVDEIEDSQVWTYQAAGLLSGGMRLGEAAACLVFEDEDFAVARRACRVATFLAAAETFDKAAIRNVNAVSQSTLTRVMRQAQASVNEPIGACFGSASADSHATRTEAIAIYEAFGGSCRYLQPKRDFGETFGASELLSTMLGTLFNSSNGGSSRGSTVVCSRSVGGCVSAIVLGRQAA